MEECRGKGKWHVTPELLEALARGEIDPGVYLTLLLEHLVRLCPECHAGVEALSTGRRSVVAASSPNSALIDRAAVPALAFHEQQRRARRELALLGALADHPRRLAAVRRGAFTALNPALVELLLAAGRDKIHDSPTAALEAAELAVELARRLPADTYGEAFCRDRVAEARAHQANALRAAGDLHGAEAVMAEAAALLESSADDLLRAEVASFAASLAKDQRRLSDAVAHLDLAEKLYASIGAEGERLIGVWLKRAEVAFLGGDVSTAVGQARATLAALDAGTPPSLRFIAHHNLAWYLCEAGELKEAQQLLAAAEPLYLAHPDRSFRLRRDWLRGRIALGLGDTAAAEASLRAARDGFLEAGLGYDAALVALDLAVLLLEQGRTAEVREIAVWTKVLFEAQDIHREALGALSLFRQAALRDLLTVHEIRRVARYLSDLRDQPASRSEVAS